MLDKKIFIPLGIIIVIILVWAAVQSSKPPVMVQPTLLPTEGMEPQLKEREKLLPILTDTRVGSFVFSWSSPTETGVWIFFDNEIGVRATSVSVGNFDEVDNPAGYTYTSEDDYTSFAPFGQVTILKYKDEYLGIIPVRLVGEGEDAQLIYRSQKL